MYFKRNIEQNLDALVLLARHCYDLYVRASDKIRRLLNQSFFERVYVDDEGPMVKSLAAPMQRVLHTRAAPSTALEKCKNP